MGAGSTAGCGSALANSGAEGSGGGAAADGDEGVESEGRVLRALKKMSGHGMMLERNRGFHRCDRICAGCSMRACFSPNHVTIVGREGCKNKERFSVAALYAGDSGSQMRGM